MATTVATVLTRVAIDLQEYDSNHAADNTFPSGLWTQAEMMGYVSDAELDFLRRTGIIKVDSSRSWSAMSISDTFAPTGDAPYEPYANGPVDIPFAKPANIMDIERISVDKKRVLRQSSWNMMTENPEWKLQPPGPPRVYHEDDLPLGTYEFDRLPAIGYGTFRLFGDLLPAEHLSISEDLTVPDAWEQYIRWEVISIALGKDGDGQDLERSAYAHQRYELGVSLALRLVRGDNEVIFTGLSNG